MNNETITRQQDNNKTTTRQQQYFTKEKIVDADKRKRKIKFSDSKE